MEVIKTELIPIINANARRAREQDAAKRRKKIRKIKKLKIAGTVVAVITGLYICGYCASHYTVYGVITDHDYDNDILTITDGRGNNWQYEVDPEHIILDDGTVVRMTMSDNGTDTDATDDIITSIKVMH